MKSTTTPLIDFFASLYDLAYDSVNFLLKSIMKLVLKFKRTDPFKILIDFFALQYDLAHEFIIFLGEYVEWATTISHNKSTDFNTQVKEAIQVRNQNPFDIR